jgi:hypothetical protein
MGVAAAELEVDRPRPGGLVPISHDSLELEDAAGELVRGLRLRGFTAIRAAAVDGAALADLELNAAHRALERRWRECRLTLASDSGEVEVLLRLEGRLRASLRFRPPLDDAAYAALMRRLSAVADLVRVRPSPQEGLL